jgi:hypothetical protein
MNRRLPMILERCTQTVVGKHEDMLAAEKTFDELEAKMGNVPPKRRYWAGYGSLPFGTMVWEREWESMAALEAYQAKTMADPEWVVMWKDIHKIFADIPMELYASF